MDYSEEYIDYLLNEKYKIKPIRKCKCYEKTNKQFINRSTKIKVCKCHEDKN